MLTIKAGQIGFSARSDRRPPAMAHRAEKTPTRQKLTSSPPDWKTIPTVLSRNGP